MEVYSSCKKAIETCIQNQSFAIAHLYHDDKPMNMHIHDSYELYFSVSGGKQFLIDNRFYDILPGDLFFINQYEGHHLLRLTARFMKRIVISIHPEFLKKLSCESADLNFIVFPAGRKDSDIRFL